MDLIEALRKIGFTKQEALLYVTLCKKGELTGYEIAKETGISRSNAYSALASLVEKGGAYVVQHKSKKYIATPKDELLTNIRQQLDKTLNYLDKHLDFQSTQHEPYVTILGENHIINKIKHLLNSATMRIYISGNEKELLLFCNELEEAIVKGLKVVTLSNKTLPFKGTSYVLEDKIYDNFKIIIDTEEVISGKLEPSYEALYSKNPTFVNIIREAFINEIELIKQHDKEK